MLYWVQWIFLNNYIIVQQLFGAAPAAVGSTVSCRGIDRVVRSGEPDDDLLTGSIALEPAAEPSPTGAPVVPADAAPAEDDGATLG